MKPRKGLIIALTTSASQHCGFLYGRIEKVNDDGSIFVVGKPDEVTSWYVARGDYKSTHESTRQRKGA